MIWNAVASAHYGCGNGGADALMTLGLDSLQDFPSSNLSMNECFILCSMHFITSKLVSFSLWCLNFQGILTPPAQFALGKICMASEVL
jgi:hypothetical protein